jgi:hypothetical protein
MEPAEPCPITAKVIAVMALDCQGGSSKRLCNMHVAAVYARFLASSRHSIPNTATAGTCE